MLDRVLNHPDLAVQAALYQRDLGVDWLMQDQPRDLTRGDPAVTAPQEPPKQVVAKPQTLEALYAAIEAFEGCVLKETAMNTVIYDGNPGAKIMLVGEAPGADEDRQGKPFVGVSGQLLDKMLAAIGLDRSQVLITNMVFWRPPGNRKPSPNEVAACLPFTRQHIALVNPSAIAFVGGLSAQSLLDSKTGITRLRGNWMTYEDAELGLRIPALPMLHPAYLLRQPKQKREAWLDMLSFKSKLRELGLIATV